MIYNLSFYQSALKEWESLDTTVKAQFKKKLIEGLQMPKVESARLRGMPDWYKIKLKSSGYRLVYKIMDKELLIIVIAVGKRDRNEVYKRAAKRI